MKYHLKRIIRAFLFLSMVLNTACSLLANENVTSQTRRIFEEWAVQAGIPYQDVSYRVIENDGAFATVRVTASLRTSAAEDWLQKQVDVECRQVGGAWQCNSAFAFSLTPEEQAQQDSMAAGTATASTIKFQATATELAQQASATQKVLAATQAFAELNAQATATAISLNATATALVVGPTPENIAPGKAISASGFYRGGESYSFRPTSIVDGLTNELHCTIGSEGGNTYWLLPDHQTGWVQVDLQQTYSIVKLRWLNTQNGGCGDRATTRFHITLRQNGASPEDEILIYHETMAFTLSPEFQEFILPEPLLARYVRFYVDDYYDWGGGLNELEIYALPSP